MAEKKAAGRVKSKATSTTAKGTSASKTSAVPRHLKKAASKTMAKGQSYSCEVCGLVVTVDEVCGCIDACDIICCGEPMQAA
jgi:hypothetical protein